MCRHRIFNSLTSGRANLARTLFLVLISSQASILVSHPFHILPNSHKSKAAPKDAPGGATLHQAALRLPTQAGAAFVPAPEAALVARSSP